MIDWENTRGKSPTPNGGYKKDMKVHLESAEAVISTGDIDLIACFFKSIVMYELYGDEPEPTVTKDKLVGSIAYRTQTALTDKCIASYRKTCIKNYENITGEPFNTNG